MKKKESNNISNTALTANSNKNTGGKKFELENGTSRSLHTPIEHTNTRRQMSWCCCCCCCANNIMSLRARITFHSFGLARIGFPIWIFPCVKRQISLFMDGRQTQRSYATFYLILLTWTTVCQGILKHCSHGRNRTVEHTPRAKERQRDNITQFTHV